MRNWKTALGIESSAIINLRGVSTKLYFNLIFTMQTYKELTRGICLRCFTCSSCVVDVKDQIATGDRVLNVEDGIEVGQDNLGMDSLDEETPGAEESLPGTNELL